MGVATGFMTKNLTLRATCTHASFTEIPTPVGRLPRSEVLAPVRLHVE